VIILAQKMVGLTDVLDKELYVLFPNGGKHILCITNYGGLIKMMYLKLTLGCLVKRFWDFGLLSMREISGQ
jgi:hypothetical protein